MRPGEGAFFVPEELALDELAAQPRAVDVDEGPFERAPSAWMPCKSALARCLLLREGATEQSESRQSLDFVFEEAHRAERGSNGRKAKRESLPVCRPRRRPDGTPDDLDERAHLDGLGEEVLGTFFHGAHGDVDRAVARS